MKIEDSAVPPRRPLVWLFCGGYLVLVSLSCLKTYASKQLGRVRRLVGCPTPWIKRKCRP